MGLNAQFRQSGVDHGRRIDLLHVQRTPVRRISLFGPIVGILDEDGGDITLPVHPVKIDRQSAYDGKKEDQKYYADMSEKMKDAFD